MSSEEAKKYINFEEVVHEKFHGLGLRGVKDFVDITYTKILKGTARRSKPSIYG